jgi:hypothetical protein
MKGSTMLKMTSHLIAATLIVAAIMSQHAFAEELSINETLGGNDCCYGGVECGACDGLVLDVFFAGDGWKARVDDSDGGNNFGFRMGLNSSIGSWNGIRGQLGGSVGGYNFYGRDDEHTEATEVQTFLTAGAFKRADVCCGERISWGAVWDYMSDNRFGEDADPVDLNQIRYLVGYALNECHEIGLWGAFGLDDDTGDFNGIETAEPMDQYNLYWRRQWEFGGETMLYTGIANDTWDQGEWIIGFNGRVPLNDRTSLFGGVHFIKPSTTPGDVPDEAYAEETWNVTFGFVWTCGPGSARGQNAPLLPVADNGWFSVASSD